METTEDAREKGTKLEQRDLEHYGVNQGLEETSVLETDCLLLFEFGEKPLQILIEFLHIAYDCSGWSGIPTICI